MYIFHFTVVRFVVWPLNESEAGSGLVLRGTSLLFLCELLLINRRTTFNFNIRKEGRLHRNLFNSSLAFIQWRGN